MSHGSNKDRETKRWGDRANRTNRSKDTRDSALFALSPSLFFKEASLNTKRRLRISETANSVKE
jgi:hypothetical protein